MAAPVGRGAERSGEPGGVDYGSLMGALGYRPVWAVNLDLEFEPSLLHRGEPAPDRDLLADVHGRLVADADVRADGGLVLVEVTLSETEACSSIRPIMAGVDSTATGR